MIQVKHPQDFWSGLLFMLVGAGALWMGREYTFGTSTRMGPGYLPMVLASILVAIGLFLAVRGAVVRGEALQPSAIRPQVMIVLAIVIFAQMIERFGLAPAVFVTTIVAALATTEMRWKETIPLAIAAALLSVGLFIYLLGQSMQAWDWSF